MRGRTRRLYSAPGRMHDLSRLFRSRFHRTGRDSRSGSLLHGTRRRTRRSGSLFRRTRAGRPRPLTGRSGSLTAGTAALRAVLRTKDCGQTLFGRRRNQLLLQALHLFICQNIHGAVGRNSQFFTCLQHILACFFYLFGQFMYSYFCCRHTYSLPPIPSLHSCFSIIFTKPSSVTATDARNSFPMACPSSPLVPYMTQGTS